MLPDDWEMAALTDVADYRAGRTPARSNSVFWEGPQANLPWVSIADMAEHQIVLGTKEKITPTAAEVAFRGRYSPAGTLLMSFKLTIGRVATLGVDAFHNEAIISIFPKKGIDQRYLGYWLSQVDYDQLHDRQIKGNTLNREKIDRIPVARPPESEQKVIADVLDAIRESISIQTASLEACSALKTVAMRELFTRGLRKEDQKDSEIGPIPQSWDVVPFSELISVPSGLVDPRIEPYASMLHVGPEDIEQDGGLLQPLQTAKELSLISGKFLFGPGQIIYSKIRPYLNKAILADFSGICSADMYPLDVKCDFDPKYVLALLRSRLFVDQAIKDQGRTGIPKLNREQLYSIKAPKAGTDEQKEIGNISAAIDAKIDLHKRKKTVLEELFHTLLHKLMAAEIRVANLDLAALKAQQGMVA